MVGEEWLVYWIDFEFDQQRTPLAGQKSIILLSYNRSQDTSLNNGTAQRGTSAEIMADIFGDDE